MGPTLVNLRLIADGVSSDGALREVGPKDEAGPSVPRPPPLVPQQSGLSSASQSQSQPQLHYGTATAGAVSAGSVSQPSVPQLQLQYDPVSVTPQPSGPQPQVQQNPLYMSYSSELSSRLSVSPGVQSQLSQGLSATATTTAAGGSILDGGKRGRPSMMMNERQSGDRLMTTNPLYGSLGSEASGRSVLAGVGVQLRPLGGAGGAVHDGDDLL